MRLDPDENPSCVAFEIKFKSESESSTADLYNEFQTMLINFKETTQDNIQINTYCPDPIRKNINTKPEYYDQVVAIKKENLETELTLNNIRKQLDNLGCHYNIDDCPMKSIPLEYYNWDEYIDYSKAIIRIYCQSETKFYKLMNDFGLLHKYYEWPDVCSVCNSIKYILN